MKVVDLFCGAGGLSLGLEMAGFNICAGIDTDVDSISTFSSMHPNALAINKDVLNCLEDLSGVFQGSAEPNILVGGPPCQGFCAINPTRSVNDPRNSCLDAFLHTVNVLKPDAVILENVTGFLSLGKGFAPKKLRTYLEECGYTVSWMVLQAAHYGAPQNRWRFIAVASLRGSFSFPEPTHHADMKPNVAGGKSLTFLTRKDQGLFDNYLPTITVWEAISDLPRVENGQINEDLSYAAPPSNDFQLSMRQNSVEVSQHSVQRLAKINMDRVLAIPEGGNWQSLPGGLVPANIKKSAEKWGRYTPTRFGRLKKDGQFTTILTKPEPYWGSFIHPVQHRLISAREAARAQTFPDHILFNGRLSSKYRQIGNAVPPVVGYALGKKLVEHFR